eukprot:scaffold78380_cov61-Phaeocystis_antarctica.AAC.5
MSAAWPRLVCKLTLAPRFSSSLTISRWPWAAAPCSRVAQCVDRPFLVKPLDHLRQLASLCRLVDLEGKRGIRAHHGLASVRWGGRRGGGRLRRRCVLPDELRDGRVALVLSPLQGGAALFVEQLGVGLGSQQGLHARLVPSASGHHQGGGTLAGLQVGVGRVLQQDEHDGEVAAVRSDHERSEAEAVWQVDARAPFQQLPHDLQLVVGCGNAQQGRG